MPLVLVLDDRRVPLDRAILLGADAGCDVVVAGLSPKHARIEPDGEWTVVRGEGGNDVVVNEVRLAEEEARALLPGDRVRIGSASGKVAYEETVVPAKTAELALAALKRARTTPRITIVSGPARGAHLDLEVEGQPVRVGRTRECDWVLDDPTLSRAHVRFVLRGGSVLVRDLESARGTFIGGSRLEPNKDATWDPRCSVRIGKTVLSLMTPLAVEEVIADVVQKHPPPEPLPLPKTDKPAEPAPAPPADAAQRAPVADAPATSPTEAPRRSHTTTIVLGLGAALIVGCIVVLLWIFGVFSRT